MGAPPAHKERILPLCDATSHHVARVGSRDGGHPGNGTVREGPVMPQSGRGSPIARGPR